jgi:hypothetical protein
MWDVKSWLNEWLLTHDSLMATLTIWMMLLGFGGYGLVKGITWWEIRNSTDKTETGRALKQQKAVEAIAWFIMAALYGVALLGIYDVFSINIWGTTLIRFWAGLSLLSAVSAGVVFNHAFIRDGKLRDEAVNLRQDQREVAQNRREEVQDTRERDWSVPGEPQR